MRARASRWATLAALAATLALASSRAAAAPAFRAATVEHGGLHRLGETWILELDGSPAERGRAAGLLVGEQVRWLLPRYLAQVASVKQLSAAQKRAVAALAAGVPAAHLAQLGALAAAARVDGDALLAANLAPELRSALACSSVGASPERSRDGVVRLARNLDWPGGELLAGLDLVVIESGAGHRFASLTWPGLVAVVTGMNDAGLVAADLMAYPRGSRQAAPGIPVLFAVRHMLEQTGSVESALAWLKAAPRTLPQNYALADPRSVRTVETGPTHFRVRDGQGGLHGITNFWDEDRGGHNDGRYGRMMKSLADAKLGPAELQAALARVALGKLNVQAALLEPATRTVHVAQGEPPVASGKWTRLDLAPWLGLPRPPIRRKDDHE
jgi:hypothetical protein